MDERRRETPDRTRSAETRSTETPPTGAHSTGSPSAACRIDTTVAHPARRYDYFLGGKDNFAADRESGDKLIAAFPTARLTALENRGFMRRAVTYLAGRAGIRQFLDIGTGIPTSPNTHEIAQRIAPGSRVVYVDNDPIVLTHARALLSSTAEGATAYLDADLHRTGDILAHPDLHATIDLSQPVALMLIAVLHFIPDGDDPYEIVARLVRALAPGSYLAMSHATFDFLPARTVERVNQITGPETFRGRSKAEFGAFFRGLEFVEPGIVSVAEWRAEGEPWPRPSAADAAAHCAVARIPG